MDVLTCFNTEIGSYFLVMQTKTHRIEKMTRSVAQTRHFLRFTLQKWSQKHMAQNLHSVGLCEVGTGKIRYEEQVNGYGK